MNLFFKNEIFDMRQCSDSLLPTVNMIHQSLLVHSYHENYAIKMKPQKTDYQMVYFLYFAI